eukprot:gene1327-1300_t
MKPILQNLVEMTGHRDHLRLEVSVLSTLQKLSSIIEVRALELFTEGGVPHVRPRTWVDNGQLVSTDSEAAADPRREPLDHYPALRDCVDNRGERALASPRRGRHVLWLPVWMHDKVSTCLEITQSRPFSAHKLDVLMGVFQVYQNYQSLLDYSERDALTGLFNRKTFDEQFSRYTMSGLASRSGAVTESFAAEETAVASDNEPFVVLLRSTTLSTAHKVFNRFRLAVQEYHFPQVGQVTVSLGFVSTTRGSPVEILGQADQALYYAKEHGRNQVCFYDDLVASGHLATKVANDDVELF